MSDAAQLDFNKTWEALCSLSINKLFREWKDIVRIIKLTYSNIIAIIILKIIYYKKNRYYGLL